jgi:hypothetical protein
MITNTVSAAVKPWPVDCYIQGGRRGFVFRDKGAHYVTPFFFEAFPTDPQTFLRGEGDTMEAAEAQAWKRWERVTACPGHEYEARGYTNGLGFCRHCGMSKSGAFTAEQLGLHCAACGVPANYAREGDDFYCTEHNPRRAEHERMMRQLEEPVDEDELRADLTAILGRMGKTDG